MNIAKRNSVPLPSHVPETFNLCKSMRILANRLFDRQKLSCQIKTVQSNKTCSEQLYKKSYNLF